MTTSQVSYVGSSVRQVTRKDGEWYVLADVCGSLGLDEDKARASLDAADLDGLLVSEAGALTLTARSNRPAAREFQRRVLAGEP